MAEPDGTPYAIPISYEIMGNAVYIHCAKEGRKIKTLATGPAVCFSCVGATLPVFDGTFSTYYESVIVFGTVREVTDEKEKRDALIALCKKYLPQDMDKADDALQKSWDRTAVYAISIDHITGKAKRQKIS